MRLGKIETFSLKTVFHREDNDFTPWLCENIGLLADVLNLELIDISREERIGKFSCDIIAREAQSGELVIIENQFEATDHDHLGKVLTYAAGKGAGIIIWIAESFREEHKKVLEWLNERMNPEEGPSFFGVELRLIRIGDSLPAPDFRVVVQPNNWERMMKLTSGGNSERKQRYYEFFTMLADAYHKANPHWRKVKPQFENYLDFGAGKSGLRFGWVFRGNNRFSVELYIDTGDEKKNKNYFDILFSHKEEIESKIPEAISWERLEGRQASRIAIYKPMNKSVLELSDQEQEELIQWGVETMKVFESVLSKWVLDGLS